MWQDPSPRVPPAMALPPKSRVGYALPSLYLISCPKSMVHAMAALETAWVLPDRIHDT